MAAATLEVWLLGRFAVRVGGRDVDVPSRPAQTLLAYLVLSAGTRHRRERLAALLWPDADEERARQNLRNTVWKLNKAIGEGFVKGDKLSVWFDADTTYDADVARLEAQGDGSVDHLLGRVAAYGGELLPGLYDEWVLLERDRLVATYERTAAAALDALAAMGRWREAIAWAERWIALGLVPERAYRTVMRAHHALGEASGVAAAFERCRRDLAQALGVEPSEETVALVAALAERPAAALSRSSPGGVREAASAPRARAGPSFLEDAAARRPPRRDRFVGRERELQRLDRALRETLAGRGQVVLVTGEAGSGKSSLVSTFCRRALERHDDLAVAIGACEAFSGPGDPFLPFREVLAVLTGDVESRWRAGTVDTPQAVRMWSMLPVAVEALLAKGGDLLDTLVPSQALLERAAAYARSARLADLDAHVEEAVAAARVRGPDRTRLLDSVADVVELLAEHHPVVIALDDLQWADTSSIHLFFHLARRAGGRRVLLLGTYRPEEVDVDDTAGTPHPLVAVAAELARHHGDLRLDLDRTAGDPAAARAFVDALVDREPNALDAAFRRKLLDHTGGHALFTSELLNDMTERGVLRHEVDGGWRLADAIDWAAVPSRVEGVIRARIDRLPTSLRAVLAAASVEGETFTAEVVARMVGSDTRTLVSRLAREADRRHRLVRDEGIGRQSGVRVSRYRFRHAAFQRFLYDELTASERAHLHEAVARALEDLHGPGTREHAVALARHLREAGLVDEAARYLLEAGRHALELAALDEAVAHLREGLELVRGAESASDGFGGLAAVPGLEPSLLLSLGLALQARDGYGSEAAGATFAAARAAAAREGVADIHFQATWNEWGFHVQHARLEHGGALADELLSVARASGDDGALLQALHALWFTALSRGQFVEAAGHAEAGIDLYDRARHHPQSHAFGGHDPGVCARLFAARALWHVGESEAAEVRLDEALSLATDLGHPPTLVHAKVFAAEVRLLLGHGAGAREAAREALDLAHDLGLAHWSAWSTVLLGCALAADGDPDGGIATLEEGLEAYAATGGELERPVFLARLAEAYARRGDDVAAARHLAAAADLVERTGERRCDAILERLRGELLRREGRADEAAQAFERALDHARRQGAKALETAVLAASAPAGGGVAPPA